MVSIALLALLTTICYSRIVLADSFPLPGLDFANDRKSGHPVDHDENRGKLGAVTSLSARCSRVGIDMLKKGGNAADAAIATEFCVGVIGMASTGLGGGGFALIRDAHGSYEHVDFRETAPAAAFQDMYNEDDMLSLVGGLASGVPGALRGLEYLHKKYAKLSWAELIKPSIRIARDGFPVSQDLVNIFYGLHNGSFLVDDPAWAVDFAPNGTLLGLGDILTRKRYAKLLEDISMNGVDVFYTGHIAEATIAALRASKGIMTMADLRDYTIVTRNPLTANYRNFRITSSGAPSSGAVVLSVLKTTEGYTNVGQPESINISTHRFDEAIRFGFGARTQLADPSFFNNITEFEQSMISDATAAKIRSLISDQTTLPVSAYDPSGIEILETPGTSHIVAADVSGLAISLTSTINLWFGSHLIVPDTGLIMNNEMNDFSIPGISDSFGLIPSPFNYVAPGKRPQSSMSPTIVEHLGNGSLYYVLGGSGGSRIITSVLQCLWNVLDREMTFEQAVAEPRFHDQLVPDVIEYEYQYDNRTTAFMSQRGHSATWTSKRRGEVQALGLLANGKFEAAAEPSLTDSAGYVV
ncbi:gamma-glutamyltranspeptidase [Immersiella caudata]|uniref:Glutathione hydrolase n=1 Tax=Immersiella caudata TaxID=314043 RepID=A0AA39WK41_9PEZI|nr:gamma-glutamyltranspeptidase [Immersiella caudata]